MKGKWVWWGLRWAWRSIKRVIRGKGTRTSKQLKQFRRPYILHHPFHPQINSTHLQAPQTDQINQHSLLLYSNLLVVTLTRSPRYDRNKEWISLALLNIPIWWWVKWLQSRTTPLINMINNIYCMSTGGWASTILSWVNGEEKWQTQGWIWLMSKELWSFGEWLKSLRDSVIGFGPLFQTVCW